MVRFRTIDKDIVKKGEIGFLRPSPQTTPVRASKRVPFGLVCDQARIVLGEGEVQFTALEDLSIGEELKERAPL